MWPNPQKTSDLVTFTEEILNEKLPFLWSALETEKVEYLMYLQFRYTLFFNKQYQAKIGKKSSKN